jgi:VCBS repeat-containing protein
LVIDSVAPSTPVITSSSQTNDPTPEISGTAEAFSTVTVIVDAVTVGTTRFLGARYTVKANAAGIWTVDTGASTNANQTVDGTFAAASNVTRSVTVLSSDAASNTTTPVTQSLTIDTVAPLAATFDGMQASGSNSPVVSGRAEAGATVTVQVNGATYKATADTAGRWSLNTAADTPVSGIYSPPTTSGALITSSVTQTADRAGNTLITDVRQVTTYNPDTPVITSSLYTQSAVPILRGTAKALSTVTVTIQATTGGPQATYDALADNDGNWVVNTQSQAVSSGSFTPLSGNSGSYTVTAKLSSSPTTSQTLLYDRVAPVLTLDSARLTDDNVINAAEQGASLSGTVEAGATVSLAFGALTRTATLNSDGSWRYTLSAEDITALGESSTGQTADRSIIVTARDRAGNTSAVARNITVDTLRPVIDLDRTTAGSDYTVAYGTKNTSYSLSNRTEATQTDASIAESQPVTRIDIGITPVTPTNGSSEFLQIGNQNLALNGVGIPQSVIYAGVTWVLSYNAGTLSLQASAAPKDALAAQALLRNLRYINTSSDPVGPNEPDRVFAITVYDFAGNASNTARAILVADGKGPELDLNGPG